MLLICYGTRPEYIKVRSLIEHIKDSVSLFTGQHETLIGEHTPTFTITIENESTNRLNNIVSSILKHPEIFKNISYVLVQGDTTSAFAIALSAFHCGIPIIHLEAGLRTYMHDPYPEEMNRCMISKIATYHLCPTSSNKQNLLNEKINPQHIFISGNTGLDNIEPNNITYDDCVLITMHRRENLESLFDWFVALNSIARKYPHINFIFPMHPNPIITQYRYLLTNVNVIEPLNHVSMINLLKKVKLIISDSGGLQEEASYLNKKIIVCRKTTERPETLGHSSFLCISPFHLSELVDYHINTPEILFECPYGNGHAWKNIISIFTELKIIK